MKISKLNLGRLFYNNRIVLIFSIILAFISWIALSTSSTETTTKLITDIPINVPLSESAKDSGLVVFGAEDIKAEISVSGNRLILGQLTKNDIQINAQQSANMINSAGKYTLELSAKKNSMLTDYEFANSVSPQFITVFVDRYKSQEFEITPNIQYTANPDYFVSPVALSEPKVTISGPDSIISTIASVSVEGNISGTLNKTTSLNHLQINLFDSAGNKINTKHLNLNVTSVDATITILPRKSVNIKPTFTSTPNDLDISSLAMQVSPSTVEIAAPEDMFNSINEISLESIDFSKINPEHTQFEVPLKMPSECRNLNNTLTSILKINLSGYQSKFINVTNVLFKNLASDKSAEAHVVSLPIQIVGPYSQVKSINPSDIIIEVDLANKPDFIGRTEFPAKIVFKSSPNKCWAYGNYQINASITKK